MWTAVLFTLLVAGATAEFGWKPNSEYRYEINTKTLASLNQVSDHYTGVVLRALVKIQPKTDRHLTVQITEPKYAEIQTSLPQGVETHLTEGQLHYQPLALTSQPFEVKLNNGIVDELIISKEVPIWEVNIIRSIVSQLQVDTQGVRIIHSKMNSIPKGDENTALYKVMEDTVEGECEVLYDVTPLPKYILQTMPHLAPQPQLAGQGQIIDIVKSKNFSNCEQRPGYHFGLTGLTDWEPTTNKMGNFLSRSSVSRVIVSGSLKSYTIQSSVTTNKVVLSPEVYNSQKGEVVSRVNLTLLSVHSAQGDVSGPQNPQALKKLVYDYNSPWTTDAEAREKWDQRMSARAMGFGNIVRKSRSIGDMMRGETELDSTEEWHQKTPTMSEAPESPFLPYFVGITGHSIHSAKQVDVNQVVKKLTGEIGQQLHQPTQVPKESTLARFTILTRVLRTMSAEQLEKITQELYTPEETNTVSDPKRNGWMAYRDALVQAGTGPALMTLFKLVTTHKIKGEEAAQVIGTLTETARFPTTEYMNTFFELVKHPEVVKETGLNTSAVFAFTNLVRMAQVNMKTAHNRYPVHTFGYLTPKHETTVSDVYIPYFAQQLEQGVKEGYSPKIQTYIRALGNIAHPKIVEVFEPYLNGKQQLTDFQRTLMVVSLNKLAIVHPKLARTILYKTYANTGEVYQVRVAAVYNLMKTIPPASMLQRMAQFTHDDPSNQVRSAVKSAIASAADLTEEHHNELRKNAEAAVHLLTPQTFGVQYSQHNLTDYVLKGLNLEYLQTVSNIGSEDSLIPQTVFFHLNRDMNGLKHQTVTAGGMVSSFKDLGDVIDGKFKYGQYLETVKKIHSETEKGFTLESLTNLLNLESGSTKQLEGNLLIGLTGFKRFITFDNTTIERLPKFLKEFTQELEKGKTINYQKLYNEYTITIGLPTATGLPLVYTLGTPTLLSAKGKIHLQTTPEQHQKSDEVYVMPDTIKSTIEMEFQYSTRTQSKVTFLTPFNHKRYVAGFDKNTQFEIPVKKHMDLDLKNRHIKVEVKPLRENTETKLFHYSTWPYVATDDILEFKPLSESSKIHRVQSHQTKKYQHELGDKEVGVVLRVQGESDREYSSMKQFYQRFLKHGFVSALLASTASENMEQTSLEVYYDGQKSTAKSVVLTASYEYTHAGETTGTEGQGEENLATTTTRTVDSDARRKEFLMKVKQGIKGSSSVVVDLGLEVQGQTKSEYLTTLATATSPIDGQIRILSYSRKNVNNKNFEVCFDAVSRLPKLSVVDYTKVLTTDLKGEIHGKLHFGEDCKSGSKVTILGDLKRSQERKEYLEKQPVVEQAKQQTQSGYKLQPSQVHATKEAGILDDYTFTIKYENVPEDVKRMTYQTYSALRYLGYPYLTENILGQTNLQEGQVELGVNFTPDLKAVDVYVYTPLGDSKFSNIYLNKYLARGLTIHPAYSTVERIANVALNEKYGPSCTIDQSNFRTFDNKSYDVNLENIWHVMLFSDLKGTYQTPLTTVQSETTDYLVTLVKNTEHKRKALKLIVKGLDYTVVDITPKPDGEQLRGLVTVNGQEVPVSTQHVYETKLNERTTVLQVYGLPTGEVKIVSPLYKFTILYYGDNVRMSVNQDYMDNVKGLCGNNNGDNFDFITPQDYVLHNPEEFAATWALSTEGRTGELKNRAQKHAMFKKSVNVTPVISKQDITHATHATHGAQYEVTETMRTDETHEETSAAWKQLKKNSSTGCATTRIHVIEKDGKHCFSVSPQPACTPQCHAESTQTKTGEFYCVEKSSTSNHWEQMVVRGANPDFRNKGKTQHHEYQQPIKCVQ
ncbi:hypothetical protein RUM44_006588 [Polyplax serrata]|uniref:Vitellogenin n=1 Tax=Polyplax serrata TaxID=468196 RepID=A0ABR1AK25_POLSC